MTKQSPKRHECGSLWKSVKTIVRITCWAWNSVQPKPIEIYICKQEWWGGRMHRNEAWSWNAVIKAVGGEKAINWLPSSHWKRSGNGLSAKCHTFRSCFSFVLSFPFKQFKLFLFMLQIYGRAFWFCSILSWQTPAHSTFMYYTFNNQYDSIRTKKKKKKKKNPTQEISQHHHGLRELAAVTGGNL